MPFYTDQIGEVVELQERVSRIVSLVPSQTELLYDLDLDQEVVGITKFCIHPKAWALSKTRVGGTKKISLDRVKALKPDLIIGNKEENTRKDIEQLRSIAPVWVSDIASLPEALEMIRVVGLMTGRSEKANQLNAEITTAFKLHEEFLSRHEGRVSVIYGIWNDPFMAVGRDTFIDDMLTRCGFTNLIELSRYPEIDLDTVQPDLILLSSEPYPFTEAHGKALQLKYPNSKVLLVDGTMFSWYGSRLRQTPQAFKELWENYRNT